jgi:GTPase SAR1 family protein
MFNQLKKQLATIPKVQIEPEVNQNDAVIRIIGDRASGKTTYMAALARSPNSNPNGLVQDITAVNDDGDQLIAKAQNILEQGLELEPTDLQSNAEDVNDYQLSITLKERFNLKSSRTVLPGSLTKLNVSCKDYAGEFFSDLLYQSNSSQLTSYLEDCSQATGIMFLLDGSASRRDVDYASGIEKFLKMLPHSDQSLGLHRVALVLTKCELPDLWMKRQHPQKLAQQQFKQVYSKLRSWEATTATASVEFFATSAFGVIGSRLPEANSRQQSRDRGGVTAVLKDTKNWRPFGLVAPIYWLCTGNRHNQLDEE